MRREETMPAVSCPTSGVSYKLESAEIQLSRSWVVVCCLPSLELVFSVI